MGIEKEYVTTLTYVRGDKSGNIDFCLGEDIPEGEDLEKRIKEDIKRKYGEVKNG